MTLQRRSTDQFGKGGTACKQTNLLSKEQEIEPQIFGIPDANSAAGGTGSSERLNNSPQSYLFNKKHNWDRDSEPRLFISMICYLPSNQLRKSFKIDKYKGSVGNVSLVYIYKANGWCTTGENIEESSE